MTTLKKLLIPAGNAQQIVKLELKEVAGLEVKSLQIIIRSWLRGWPLIRNFRNTPKKLKNEKAEQGVTEVNTSERGELMDW